MAENEEQPKCIVCGEPATIIDHYHPYEQFNNRCERHKSALIDEDAYNRFGVGIVVCRQHHDLLNMIWSIEQMQKNIEHECGETSSRMREVMSDLIDLSRKLEEMKWEREIYRPKISD